MLEGKVSLWVRASEGCSHPNARFKMLQCPQRRLPCNRAASGFPFPKLCSGLHKNLVKNQEQSGARRWGDRVTVTCTWKGCGASEKFPVVGVPGKAPHRPRRGGAPLLRTACSHLQIGTGALISRKAGSLTSQSICVVL